MHRVVAVAIPDVILFDLAIPAEVFGRAIERDRYSFTVCTERPGVVSCRSGVDMHVLRGLRALDAADTVLVPGFHPREPSATVIRALRRAADRGARVASVCVGAFARRFVDETGTAPLRWLTAQRLLEARRLLEASDVSVEEVAQRTGLRTAANLRLHLAREVGTTPTAYRSAFRGAPTPKIPEATIA
jgi:transcriptional regulator GlxA family with amidase domain